MRRKCVINIDSVLDLVTMRPTYRHVPDPHVPFIIMSELPSAPTDRTFVCVRRTGESARETRPATDRTAGTATVARRWPRVAGGKLLYTRDANFQFYVFVLFAIVTFIVGVATCVDRCTINNKNDRQPSPRSGLRSRLTVTPSHVALVWSPGCAAGPTATGTRGDGRRDAIKAIPATSLHFTSPGKVCATTSKISGYPSASSNRH